MQISLYGNSLILKSTYGVCNSSMSTHHGNGFIQTSELCMVMKPYRNTHTHWQKKSNILFDVLKKQSKFAYTITNINYTLSFTLGGQYNYMCHSLPW